MEFRVLGPLELVGATGNRIELGAARERALLLRLLIDANQTVTADRLIDDLWEARPPRTALRTLRVYVSRLRGALGEPDRIRTTSTGYLLRLDPEESDAIKFDSLVAQTRRPTQARKGTPDGNWNAESRAAVLYQALALWRGSAFADVADAAWARPDAARLQESRMGALEERIELDLAAGRDGALVAELELLCAREPLRERLWSARMLALYRSGRAADALAAFQELRSHLVDELGLEPSRELRELQARILAEDPTLHGQPDGDRPASIQSTSAAPTAAVRGNISPPRTSFVGGESDAAELRTLLGTCRGPVTLAGPPGAGKTRLAVEVAASLAADYAGGAWLVELAPVRDESLLAARIAETIGIAEQAGRGTLETLSEALGSERILIVLDNCEHVGPECAHIVDQLLAACGALVVLATSREPLGVEGEIVRQVRPLAVPDPGVADVDEIAEADACRLFLDRARGAGARIDLERGTSAAAVAEICRRLDGLPLALELAAARTTVLSVNDIAARFDDMLGLLASRGCRRPERQRTLRALIDWSYSLLEEPERVLLRRLAVFPGGAPLRGAEEVCTGPPLNRSRCVDLLQSLVERSLVIADTSGEEARYELLETIRAFGLEQLNSEDELAQLRDAHAHWCVELVAEARRQWEGGDQAGGLELISREQDNWRIALARLVELSDGPEATRLVACLGQWWYVNTRTQEGRVAIDSVLALSAPPSSDRAIALRFAGALARINGDFDAARRHIADGIAIASAIEDYSAVLQLQISLGAAAWLGGDVDSATATLTEALETARELGDRRAEGSISYNLGVIARNAERLDEALDRLACAREAWRDAGDERGLALVSGMTATVLMRQGDRSQARREVGEALLILSGTSYVEAIVEQLETIAVLDAFEREYVRAARLIGQADHRRATERLLRPPVDEREIQQTLSVVREHLGADTDRQLGDGGRMPLQAAVLLALDRSRETTADQPLSGRGT